MRLFRLVVVAAALSLPHLAAAQTAEDEAPREEQGGKERELNQHRFVIPSDIDHAFMVTSLAFDQGFGVLTVKNQDIDGKLFLLRERFRLQLGWGNRLALEATADAHAGVAGNIDTLLALAGVANLEFAVGPKARLLTLPELGLQLSAGVNFRPSLTYSVSPASIAGGSTNQILQKESVSFIQPGLMVAWGQGALGLQLAIRPALTTNKETSPSELQAGATLGLDFGNLTDHTVPLALAVEYNMTKPFDGSDTEHVLTSGLFYSAKRDLQLGLRASRLVGKSDSTLHFATLNLGYFF